MICIYVLRNGPAVTFYSFTFSLKLSQSREKHETFFYFLVKHVSVLPFFLEIETKTFLELEFVELFSQHFEQFRKHFIQQDFCCLKTFIISRYFTTREWNFRMLVFMIFTTKSQLSKLDELFSFVFCELLFERKHKRGSIKLNHCIEFNGVFLVALFDFNKLKSAHSIEMQTEKKLHQKSRKYFPSPIDDKYWKMFHLRTSLAFWEGTKKSPHLNKQNETQAEGKLSCLQSSKINHT